MCGCSAGSAVTDRRARSVSCTSSESGCSPSWSSQRSIVTLKTVTASCAARIEVNSSTPRSRKALGDHLRQRGQFPQLALAAWAILPTICTLARIPAWSRLRARSSKAGCAPGTAWTSPQPSPRRSRNVSPATRRGPAPTHLARCLDQHSPSTREASSSYRQEA